MRVKRLRLKNFRIHGDSELRLGDSSFVVIRGRNFAGKSTVGQGISMCLTPTTTGLDPQGRGFASKIKRGAAKAVITAEIQTKRHLIERTVTLNAGATGRTQRSVCLNDPELKTTDFDKKLEERRAALTVALNTDAFLRMDEKEQKNLLAGLALPTRYEFSPMIIAEVETMLGKGAVNFEGEPFTVINKGYKLLFDERQIVNRQVKEFTIPEPLPVPAGVDSRSLQEQVTHLHMERRERDSRRQEAVREAEKVEEERQRIKAREKHLLSEEKLTYLRQVAAGKPELDRLNREKKDAEKQVDEYLGQLAHLEEIPVDVATCPTCDQSIDQERLKEMAAIAATSLQDVRDRHFALHQQAKALGDVEEALKLISEHEKARQELALLECPEPVLFDFQPYDRSISECDAEIEKLNAQLRPVIAAEERIKEIHIRQEQLSRLKIKAQTLNGLVSYFDKDGIKAKLLGEYIGGFECKLNEVLSAWGYKCVLSIEPYQFDVTNARGDTNPVRELSGAERVMFSLAFQCAVSRTANIGLVVIDEVAMLLPELRPVLNKRLYEMIQQGYLEQVILLVADTSEQVPKLPGSKVFMVEDGMVHELSLAEVA